MNTALYIVFALILIFAAWSGYKRGLVLSTAHLAAIAVSLYLACLLSSAFSGEVVSGMVPFAEGFLDHQIEETVIPEMKLDASYSVKDTYENVIHHRKDGAAEVEPEVSYRLGQNAFWGVHPPQNGGGKDHTQHCQNGHHPGKQGNPPILHRYGR